MLLTRTYIQMFVLRKEISLQAALQPYSYDSFLSWHWRCGVSHVLGRLTTENVQKVCVCVCLEL